MQNLLDMKKAFLILLLSITLTGLVVPSHLVFAGEAGESGAAGGLATVAPEAATAQQAAEATYSAEQGAAGARIAEAIKDAVIDPLGELIGGILHVITWLLVQIMTFILFLVGSFFNFVVEQLVVNMGHFVTSSDAVGIQIAWRIMRDLANLAIIGGLIATAIGTILHLAAINAQKLLVRLIIAALLVNFSFFFAGAVIDSSNFLATAIYKATISTENCRESCTIVSRFDRVIRTNNHNIAAYLADEKVGDIKQDSQWMAIVQDLLAIVVIGITIFVFLSAITLLLGRFVALILILITSPIGIAGLAIPQINRYAKEWWEALFSQAFFAPVYFLLVGFSLTILDNSSGAFSGDSPNLIGTLLTFMVAVIFMLQSLKIAKGMSEAAKRLTDVYKASNWITTNVGAMTARETIGRFGGDKLGHWYEEKIAAREWGFLGGRRLDQVPGLATLDRGIQKGTKFLKDAKFGSKTSYGDLKEQREQRTIKLANVSDYVKKKDDALKKGGHLDQEAAVKAAYDKAVARGEDDIKITAKSSKEDLIKAGLPKNWHKMSDEERAEWTAKRKQDGDKVDQNGNKLDKNGVPLWEGRRWVKDKDGNWDWENKFAYNDRLKRTEKFDTGAVDKNGEKIMLTMADATDQLKQPFADVSSDLIKEEYKRNKTEFKRLARALTTEQSLDIVKDKTIDRETRDEIRMARLGGVMTSAQAFEARVVDAVDTKKGDEKYLTADGRLTDEAKAAGKILRYSDEYNDKRYWLHEELKKNVSADELIDFFTSNPGLEMGLQENEIFNDAITSGVYTQLQKNSRIASGKKRKLRALKRRRGNINFKIDDEASAVFNTITIQDKDEQGNSISRGLSEQERNLLSRNAFDENGDSLSDKEFDTRMREQTEKGIITSDQEAQLRKIRRNKDVRRAAEKRKTAEDNFFKYAKGKAANEIQDEMKQEDLGKRLMGKYINAGQAYGLAKDTVWMEDQGVSMLVYGDESAIKWILTNPDGQSKYEVTDEMRKRVNEERRRLGMASLEEVESRLGRTSEIETIAERNASAVSRQPIEGQIEFEETPRSRIASVLRSRATSSSSAPTTTQTEGVAPESPETPPVPETPTVIEDIAPLIHNLPPAEAAELVKELPEEMLGSRDFIQELDSRQLKAIETDTYIAPAKMRAIIWGLIRAVKAGGTIRDSARAWLDEMRKQKHLTPEQETAYTDTFGS